MNFSQILVEQREWNKKMQKSIGSDQSIPSRLEIEARLEKIYQLFLKDDVHLGMDELALFLRSIRLQLQDEEWRDFTSEHLFKHPIQCVIQEDPFTNHAFTRPRGYPGDAGLLDYIYFSEAMRPCELSNRARGIYEVTTSGPSTDAVRYRRKYIAELVDRVAAKHHNSRVLSLACGHLREAELSQALRNRTVQELIAIDSDVKSLSLVEKEYGSLGIRTLAGSAYMLVAGTLDVGEVHLAYAAGLYDYLAQPFARRLTSAMFSRLARGGHVLVANFRPAIRDVGYMESFMNWPLVFRTDAEALDLFSAIPPEQIDQILITYDPHCNIVFLEAVKK